MSSLEIKPDGSSGSLGVFGLSEASRREIIGAADSASLRVHEDESQEYLDHVRDQFPKLTEALCSEVLEATTPERREAAAIRLGAVSSSELVHKFELVEATLKTALTDSSPEVRQAADAAYKSISLTKLRSSPSESTSVG